MPYTAPTIGFVTCSGYVRCVECVSDDERAVAYEMGYTIAGDTVGDAESACDTCGRFLRNGDPGDPIRTGDYVHVDAGQAVAPDITPTHPRWNGTTRDGA